MHNFIFFPQFGGQSCRLCRCRCLRCKRHPHNRRRLSCCGCKTTCGNYSMSIISAEKRFFRWSRLQKRRLLRGNFSTLFSRCCTNKRFPKAKDRSFLHGIARYRSNTTTITQQLRSIVSRSCSICDRNRAANS